MNEYEFDLFWHALNYRGAPITLGEGGAQEAWEALEACVNRLIAREREECAALIEPMGDYCGGHGEPRAPSSRNLAKAIRAKGQAC
jgi:hypothetical protein